jgi:hypothetical protein
MRDALGGDLSRVEGTVKVVAMANAAPDFRGPSKGHQRQLRSLEVVEENRQRARSAVGVGSVPAGIPIGIEVIVAIKGATGD